MNVHHQDGCEEQIISHIFSLGRFVREHAGGEKGEKIGNPSFIHLEIMKRIDDSGGLPMTDLAEYLCIKAPSVTYLVEDLVKDNFARRLHNTQDRRIVKIVLTQKGQKILKRLYPHRADTFRKVLRQLGALEQKKFAKTLERINEIYKQKPVAKIKLKK